MKKNNQVLINYLLGLLGVFIVLYLSFQHYYNTPSISNYPEENLLVGTYKLSSQNLTNRNFITIEKDKTLEGTYIIHRYRDFSENGYLPIFYIMKYDIKYNSRKNSFFISSEPIYNTILLDNNSIEIIKPDGKKEIYKKISNQILTEKKLNTNQYPVQIETIN